LLPRHPYWLGEKNKPLQYPGLQLAKDNRCRRYHRILGFTLSLAPEVVSRGIRVSPLAPGFIDTELTEPSGPVRALLEAQTPMGKFGHCDDIAWPAVYLDSDEAKFMTGQVLSPNGGFIMNQ
jgi:3-oxoacyl-[acyl-carrier protein] reductase